jgi:hypothetical protein
METISDSQVLIWFFYASGFIFLVIFLPMRLAKLTKDRADQKHKQVASLAGCMNELDPKSSEKRSEDLISFLAAYFEISPKKLTLDTHFISDLRIPASELEQCLEDIQEHFRMKIDDSKIHKVGDLLELLR